MSTNTAASLSLSSTNGKNTKKEASDIRNYIITKPATVRKPLASPDDNVVSTKKPSSSSTTTNKSKEQEAHRQRFLNFVHTRRAESSPVVATLKNSTSKLTSSTSSTLSTSPTSSSSSLLKQTRPPTLKRSHSAASRLDTVNESWMNAPFTKKQCNKKTAYDRLTPGITDMPSAQAIMKRSVQSLLDTTGNESYQEQVAAALGIDTTKRILSFQPAAPQPRNIDLTKNAPQPKLHTHTSPHVKRHILSTPEKVLDAPYMDDDYYLNVLDWSKTNVVAVGLGKSVYLWNADDGNIQALNYDYDDQVASVNWSSDGTYLAVGTTSGDTQIWDVQANTKLRSMRGQDSRIGVLGWDKHLVSSGARDGSIFHHDVRMAKHVVRELYGHTDEVCGLKWRWDGEMFASGGNDNTVNIWDARSSNPLHQQRAHTGAIKALAWCPWKRNLLATGGGRDDKKINFWNTHTGIRLNTIQAGAQVTSLHWSQHYKEIVSTHGLPHNQVTVWSYPGLNKVIDIPAHESRILHSALSPDGQVLATAAADENLKFWRVFEADGKARLGSDSKRLAEKKEGQLRRSKTLR